MGVRNVSIVLVVLWILYFIGAITGNWIWAIIWCIASILVYAAVIFGMMKTRKIFLLPPLCVSVFNVLVGIINGIINFIILNWIGAIVLLAIAGLTAYYAIGLKNVYDDMSDAPAAAEPSTEAKPPVNPV